MKPFKGSMSQSESSIKGYQPITTIYCQVLGALRLSLELKREERRLTARA